MMEFGGIVILFKTCRKNFWKGEKNGIKHFTHKNR